MFTRSAAFKFTYIFVDLCLEHQRSLKQLETAEIFQMKILNICVGFFSFHQYIRLFNIYFTERYPEMNVIELSASFVSINQSTVSNNT